MVLAAHPFSRARLGGVAKQDNLTNRTGENACPTGTGCSDRVKSFSSSLQTRPIIRSS